MNNDGSRSTHSNLRHVGVGIVSGGVLAVIFQPYDRALYESMVNGRPFFDKRNWHISLRGLDVSILQRSVTYGLFFPLESFYCDELRGLGLTGAAVPLIGGQLAGASNGVLTNGLTLVKFHKWNQPVGATAQSTQQFSELFRRFGYRVLTRGLAATVMRDSVFGGTFTFLRTRTEHSTMRGDGCAALVATSLCSPLNYARNMQYSAMDKSIRFTAPLIALRENVLRECGFFARTLKLVDSLRIGYGTIRVAAGMSLGGALYRWIEETCS